MTTSQILDSAKKRLGRPRAERSKRLVRRNLLVEPGALEQARRLYRAKSDSEAVRLALDAVVMAEEMDEIASRIAARNIPEDDYERSFRGPRLPVHLGPDDILPEDMIDRDGDVVGA